MNPIPFNNQQREFKTIITPVCEKIISDLKNTRSFTSIVKQLFMEMFGDNFKIKTTMGDKDKTHFTTSIDYKFFKNYVEKLKNSGKYTGDSDFQTALDNLANLSVKQIKEILKWQSELETLQRPENPLKMEEEVRKKVLEDKLNKYCYTSVKDKIITIPLPRSNRSITKLDESSKTSKTFQEQVPQMKLSDTDVAFEIPQSLVKNFFDDIKIYNNRVDRNIDIIPIPDLFDDNGNRIAMVIDRQQFKIGLNSILKTPESLFTSIRKQHDLITLSSLRLEDLYNKKIPSLKSNRYVSMEDKYIIYELNTNKFKMTFTIYNFEVVDIKKIKIEEKQVIEKNDIDLSLSTLQKKTPNVAKSSGSQFIAETPNKQVIKIQENKDYPYYESIKIDGSNVDYCGPNKACCDNFVSSIEEYENKNYYCAFQVGNFKKHEGNETITAITIKKNKIKLGEILKHKGEKKGKKGEIKSTYSEIDLIKEGETNKEGSEGGCNYKIELFTPENSNKKVYKLTIERYNLAKKKCTAVYTLEFEITKTTKTEKTNLVKISYLMD